MNRKFTSVFVAIGLMLGSQCFGVSSGENLRQKVYRRVSASQVFVTEKGIFFRDVDGVVRPASNLTQTRHGLVATLESSEFECPDCEKPLWDWHGRLICFTDGCPSEGDDFGPTP